MKELSLVIGVLTSKVGKLVLESSVRLLKVFWYWLTLESIAKASFYADWVVLRRESSVGVCVRIILSNLTEGIQVYEY